MGEMPDVHSCNEACQRPLCVREREILDLRRRLRMAQRAETALAEARAEVKRLRYQVSRLRIGLKRVVGDGCDASPVCDPEDEDELCASCVAAAALAAAPEGGTDG